MNKNNETARRVRGLGIGLRVGLYFALLVSALTTFIGLPALESRVQAGQLGPTWMLVPSLGFGLALTVYALDRIFLLRYRHYPAGRALFQIAFGLVFLFLLFPSSLAEYHQVVKERPPKQSLQALMKHSDPRVRCLAYEMAPYRKDPQRFRAALTLGSKDRDAQCASLAQDSLKQIEKIMATPSHATQAPRESSPTASHNAAADTAPDNSLNPDKLPASDGGAS